MSKIIYINLYIYVGVLLIFKNFKLQVNKSICFNNGQLLRMRQHQQGSTTRFVGCFGVDSSQLQETRETGKHGRSAQKQHHQEREGAERNRKCGTSLRKQEQPRRHRQYLAIAKYND